MKIRRPIENVLKPAWTSSDLSGGNHDPIHTARGRKPLSKSVLRAAMSRIKDIRKRARKSDMPGCIRAFKLA